MRATLTYVFVLFGTMLCLLTYVASASIANQRQAVQVDFSAPQVHQIMVKRARNKKPEFDPELLNSVPEEGVLTQFRTKEEVERVAEVVRYRAMLRQLGLDDAGHAVLNDAQERTPWMRRIANAWKSRVAAWIATKQAKKLAPATAEADQISLPAAAPRFTAEEIQAALETAAMRSETQYFNFKAIRNAPRTQPNGVPVVRMDSLDEKIFNAATYSDGVTKPQSLYLAFTNDQIFKVVPQAEKGFQVRPVQDELALSRVREALTRPILDPLPETPHVEPPSASTNWHAPADTKTENSARRINLMPQSTVSMKPLGDEDKIKKAFELHDDTRFERTFDVPALQAAPRTLTGKLVLQYKTLDDPIINAFSLLRQDQQTAYLVDQAGKVAYVQRTPRNNLEVTMISDPQTVENIQRILKISATKGQSGTGLRPGSLVPAQPTDLYPVHHDELARIRPEPAGALARFNEGARSWWSSVSTGARTLLDRIKPSLKYAGHAG